MRARGTPRSADRSSRRTEGLRKSRHARRAPPLRAADCSVCRDLRRPAPRDTPTMTVRLSRMGRASPPGEIEHVHTRPLRQPIFRRWRRRPLGTKLPPTLQNLSRATCRVRGETCNRSRELDARPCSSAVASRNSSRRQPFERA
jgi:hypothetical protein